MDCFLFVLMFCFGVILMGFSASRIEPLTAGWKFTCKVIWAALLMIAPVLITGYLLDGTRPDSYAASNCLTAKAYTRAVKSYYGISGNVEMPVLEHYRRGTLYWEVW